MMIDEQASKEASRRDVGGLESAQTLAHLAAYRIQKIRTSPLPSGVEEKATKCLLDYLGALISGLTAPWSRGLLSYANIAAPGNGAAHIMGLGSRMAPEVIAFTNAAIAHR